MQTKKAEFDERGVQLLGISADPATDLEREMLPKGFTFPLLSDPELVAIDAYGLRHEGGNPFGGDIARPALFLIDENGAITDRMLTENWRVRPTPEMLLDRLDQNR